MKRLLFCIGTLLSLCNAGAQNPEPTLDDALVNIDQSTVTSGIIYERVMQLANLYNFNSSDSTNMADYDYFKQALSEMHRASNAKEFIDYDILDQIVAEETGQVVPIGILNTDFEILNYRPEEVHNGGLSYDEKTTSFHP